MNKHHPLVRSATQLVAWLIPAAAIMNNTIATSDIHNYVAGHLGEVFDTMLSMKAVPGAALEARFAGEHVSGSVGVAGQTVTGSVYLHLSSAFAGLATATMLGLPPEEVPAVPDINDVVAEMTNMIAGGLKSWLCDAGAGCVLTIPAVIRGTSFSIKPKPGVELIPIGFACGETSGLVEVHIKFQ